MARIDRKLGKRHSSRLSLARCQIDDLGCHTLGDRLPPLSHLVLRDNFISKHGLVALTPSLLSLRELDLSNNVLGRKGAVAAGDLIRSSRLSKLDLANNSLGSNGALALAGALSFSPSLTNLGLAHNNICPAGALALALSLPSSRVHKLRLQGNIVADQGCLHLADYLNDSHLLQLCLQDNLVSDTGCMHLAKALQRNDRLTKLDLSSNLISTTGALHLVHALQTNYSLTVLNLTHNCIGPIVLAQIKELLNRNACLIHSVKILVPLSRRVATLDIPYDIQCSILERFTALYPSADAHCVKTVLLDKTKIGSLISKSGKNGFSARRLAEQCHRLLYSYM